MHIAILGAGIGGLSLAYFLKRLEPDVSIDIFEQASTPGGLVKKFAHRGYDFDRHYHVVLVRDEDLRALIREVGLDDQVHFQVSHTGVYDGERIHPFDNPIDFLRFPLIGLLDKARLLATMLYCQHGGTAEALHARALEPWLVGLGGRRAFDRVWGPLLRTKFDGSFDGIPATYLWSRMRRMGSTREKGGAIEKLGILRGGTSALIEALASRMSQEGVHISLETPVRSLQRAGRSIHVELESQLSGPYDLVISTLPTPIHNRVAEPAGAAAASPMPDKYLGIVDVVVALDQALTPCYVLNLLDATLPFTGVIETTNLMAPADRGDTHLVYLPRYTDAQGPIYAQSDETLKALFLEKLFSMFPQLKRRTVQQVYLFREPFVEPIHLQKGAFAPFPESLATRAQRVYLMNTGRVYPLLHNCQAVVALAKKTAEYLMERHG